MFDESVEETLDAGSASVDAGSGSSVQRSRSGQCGWFSDVTAASGVHAVHVPTPGITDGNGAGVGDLDGDGDPDLIISGGFAGETRAFRNEGGFRFTPGESLGAGIAVGLGDLDGDGDLDVVLTGATEQRLLENAGGMHFVPRGVLPAASQPGDSYAVSVLPADFDRDGDLDLFVGQRITSSLFRNDGGWRFVDSTEAWGTTHAMDGHPYTPTYFDATGDGVPDLYIPQDVDAVAFHIDDPPPAGFPGDRLLVTQTAPDGTLRFHDEAAARGLGGARSGMGVVLGDFDGDERLDVYLSNIGANPLFLARGDGTYRSSTTHDVIALTNALLGECDPGSMDRRCLVASWGSALFDVDLDGDDDLIVVNDVGFFNERDAHFERQADGSWLRINSCTEGEDSNGLAVADLDGDGDLDLVKTANAGAVSLYRNEARGTARPLRVVLRGHRSNGAGVGALVTLVRGDGHRVSRAVGAGGSPFSASPVEANFTLPPTGAASVEVLWPSGARQRVDVTGDERTLRVDEPAAS